MTGPENTTQRDPMIHLLGSMSDGTSGYIEGMEAAGQQQLVHSDSLPTEADGDESYLALGFSFGPADAGDSLFRPATLPSGWKKTGSDHSMWSYVVDDLGRRRVAIFYKAAFYDRNAFMRLETVRGYAYTLAHSGDVPVFDAEWCTREAFTTALAAIRSDAAERRELYLGKLDDPRVPWAAESLKEAEADLAKHDAWAAKALGGTA